MGTSKQAISTTNAPSAIGPYSQGIVFGDFIYLSGQIPVDAKQGTIPVGIAAQTELVLTNIAAVLKEAGVSMANVLKTTVFLTDMQNFADVNAIYARHFPAPYPARSCVAVSALPKNVLVEIEVVAHK